MYEHHKTPWASKNPKKLKKTEKFFEGQIKGTIQFYQILKIFLAFMDPLDPKNQPLPYFLFQRPLRPKRPLKGQKLLTKVLGPEMVSQGSKQSYEVI